MTSAKKTFQPLTSSDVCRIYKLLHKHGLISFPLTQQGEGRVDSIVSNIINPHFGVDLYPTIEEKVVAYLYFLIKDHPFTDGNKRTATLSFAVLCQLNKLTLDESLPLDALAVVVEKIKNEDYKTVIKAIAEEVFKQ